MEQRPYLVDQDSETGCLINRMDWAATRLGPMEAWPQSLRTSLSICVACRFPILIWWGPDMVVLYNDEYIPVLGNKHPAAMGGVGREVWHDVWPVVGPMLDTVVRTGKAVKAEDLLLLMDRAGYIEETYFSFSYSPISDESGGVGGIFTPVIETTEKVIGQRRIEKLRELASAPRADDLADACRQYAQMLAGARADVPFGLVYAIDPDGGASLVASFGLDACEANAPGRIVKGELAAPWPVLEVAGGTELVTAARADGVVLPPGAWGSGCDLAVLAPIRMSGQDGAAAVLVAGVSPHRALDDVYLSFYKLLADQLQGSIGEAMAYEADRKRVQALAEIDKAKTTFFSNVSHEFRTPLTLMLGPLQEVLDDPSLGSEPRRHLELVSRNGKRLLKLVNALLDFSRIEAGRMVARFEPVDLGASTVELAGVFRSAVERAGLSFSVDCARLPELTWVDRGMWEKIVLNLLSNAFKFTFDGGIAVRLWAEPGRAVLAVSDSGVGIAATDLPRVFERFHRVEGARSRSHEGSGIGLALVRDLVEMHGGEVRIDSTPGQGTTVTVALPFGRAHLPAEHVLAEPSGAERNTLAEAYIEEAELWLAPSQPSANHAESRARRGTIFVVDDNADMRDYVTRLLDPLHIVRGFADGSQLLAAARSWRPDLVVADVMMPVMDGYELLATLRQTPDLASIPVLLLTARAGEDERIAATRAGADGYMEKPFSSRELLAKVDALLLRARLHAIEAAHMRRMDAVFEQVPAAIALLRGPEHVVELANPEYLALIDNREVLHMPLAVALPYLEQQGIIGLLDQAYRSGEAYVGRGMRVDVMRGSPGVLEQCYFDVVYQPLRDNDGRVDGIAVVAFEVTEAIRAKRMAETANRSKDEFLAMLGHELRNPLAPIMSALEVMKLRGIGTLRKEHGIIERQARHLVGLVDDLLDVARVSEGKIELRRVFVELADVVALAVETAAPLLEERHDALRIDVPPSGLRFHVDRQRMSQVYANLLTNAAKYSDRNSTIHITGREEDGDIVLEVRDNGQGIPPEMLPRLFDMFYQDPQSLARSRGGLGLGLTIVRSLAELHGGSVSAASGGPGQGSTFTVRIPAARAVPERLETDEQPASGVTQARKRILVVDDNVDAAVSLCELLRAYGHAVETAFDAPSALDKLKNGWPDLAIFDIGLPGMDGYELAARVRSVAEGRPIKLVALTGYGQADDLSRALAAGFDEHMTKPISVERLRLCVESLTAPPLRLANGG
jgi:signal transduction histidine kinase/DNA-binding response OmpR family regulator